MLPPDDDDDDDVVDFVSIGYSRFARQSFTSASCLDFIFCFLSSRCLSPWSVRLFLLVVCLQSLNYNYAYPLVPSLEVL